MALTEIPLELSSTPSIVDNGNATAITIDASENATFAGPIQLTAGALAAAGNASLSHRSSDNKVYLQAGTGGFNILDDQQNTHFSIDSAGVSTFNNNVGIGSSPSNLLHLHKTSGDSIIRMSGGGSLGINYGGFVNGYGVSGTGGYLDLGVIDANAFRTAIQIRQQAAEIIFKNGDTERMRLSAGNLLVGTTTAAPSSTTTIKGALGLVGSSSNSTSSIKFNNSANTKYWSIDTDTANFYIADADFSHYGYLVQTMTAWAFGSDRRLKENIVDVPYGLDAVMAMQPRAFKFKSSGAETIGFVAQELQAVVPEAVTGTEVEYLDDDTPQEKANKSLGVSQDTLIPVLVKAIQEQQATIESQAAAITDLTTRLTALENN